MRFMVMVKASADTEAGVMPTTAEMEAMTRFNEELVAAGLMRGGEGLHPTSRGARVNFDGDKREVETGPFVSDDLVAGFWLLEAGSLDEVVQWMKRCPNPTGQRGQLEIRQIFEAGDFGDALTPELLAREERLRAQAQG